jgi:hypothetical protein
VLETASWIKAEELEAFFGQHAMFAFTLILASLVVASISLRYLLHQVKEGLRRFTSRFQSAPVTRRMNSKLHYIAGPNDVTVTRDGDWARIEYKEEGIPASHLEIGPEIAGMSHGEILEAYNEFLRNDAKLATKRKHVAIEVPLGAEQIEYFAQCDQWVPRGGVLRCLIEDDEHGQIVVKIDQQELRLKQFGKLLATYAGWAMRIEFMPGDEVHRRPALEVREHLPEE